MSDHTREPWHVHHDIDAGEWPMVMAGGVTAGKIVANVDPSSFCLPARGFVEMPSTANAARIVACVNACAGMDDPAAEIDRLRARIAELERQAEIGRRAVGALKEIVAEGQEFEARTGKTVKSEWFPKSVAILRVAADDARRLLAGGE